MCEITESQLCFYTLAKNREIRLRQQCHLYHGENETFKIHSHVDDPSITEREDVNTQKAPCVHRLEDVLG